MGRQVSGWHKVTVRIGYMYRLVYYPVVQDFQRAFGRVVGRGSIPVSPREVPPSIVILWQNWRGKLFADLPDPGLGRWSLTPHHIYDSAVSVLYRGDGQRLMEQESLAIVTSVAAGGGGVCASAGDPCGDGGPATAARLGHIRDVAVAPDGSMFIAEQGLNRIRKVDQAGTITTIAGNGQPCFYQSQSLCGDGGPAALATTTPFGLRGPKGELFILVLCQRFRAFGLTGLSRRWQGRTRPTSGQASTSPGPGTEGLRRRPSCWTPGISPAAPTGASMFLSGTTLRRRLRGPRHRQGHCGVRGSLKRRNGATHPFAETHGPQQRTGGQPLHR